MSTIDATRPPVTGQVAVALPGQQRAPLTAWRRLVVAAIKAIHSVIFLVNSAAILHICYAGVRNRPSRWTGPALAAALGESLVFVLNRGRCPLTDAVEALGAADGRVSDIFLPRWFADRIPQLCTPPLLIGLAALIVRAWAPEAWKASARSRAAVSAASHAGAWFTPWSPKIPVASRPSSRAAWQVATGRRTTTA